MRVLVFFSPTMQTVLLIGVFLLAVAVGFTSGALDDGPHHLRGFVHQWASGTGDQHSLWRQLSKDESHAWANKSSMIKAFIALQENQEGLKKVKEAIEAASDLTNATSYGCHLSWDNLTTLVAPSDTKVDAVVQWLKAAGMEKYEVMASCRVSFAALADALETLVKCCVCAYMPCAMHSSLKHVLIHWCEEDVYRIPCHLEHIVDFVTPLVGVWPHPKHSQVHF